jgi:hypothetical protein
VDNNSPRTSAYLLLAGLLLTGIGVLLAGVAPSAHDADPLRTWLGAVASLAGFASVVLGMVRWARRGRPAPVAAEVRRTPAPV